MKAPRIRLVGGGELFDALATLVAEAGAERVEQAADVEIWVVPVSELAREVAERRPGPADRVVLATRGLEPGTGRRPSDLVLAGSACLRVGALAGPLLPGEVRRRSPCAAVIASPFAEVTTLATAALRSPFCRAYASPDLAGVELASALVDVFAVALGAARGLGLGPGAEALLVARAAPAASGAKPAPSPASPASATSWPAPPATSTPATAAASPSPAARNCPRWRRWPKGSCATPRACPSWAASGVWPVGSSAPPPCWAP
jgi:hypothetical protein